MAAAAAFACAEREHTCGVCACCVAGRAAWWAPARGDPRGERPPVCSSRWLHQELVKHVPSFAEAMRGGKRATLRATLLGRWAAAKAVGQSKFPYANRTLGLFVADALIVDTARLLFPADARTRLVLHSAAPGEASFATNLKLKVGKHVLCGCLSYAIGVVTPLVLPAAVPYFVGFMIGDIVAVLVAEGVVAKFGEIK